MSWRRISLALVCALSAACADLQPARPHPEVGPVVLVIAQEPPRFLVTGVPDKQLAAWGGGGSFFLECATLFSPTAGVVTLAWLAGCTVAAPVAGAVHASRAPSAEELARSRASAEAKAVQQSSAALREAILAAAERAVPGRLLAAHGPLSDGELRVALESIELRGDTRASRSNPPIQVAVSLRVSLVAHDGATVQALTIPYLSAPHTLAEWTQNDAARLQSAITEALQPLAEAAVDAAFLLCRLPYKGTVSWSPEFAGLQAEAPRTYGDPFQPGPPLARSLRPTFRWEAFPRSVDRDAAPSVERARDVSYDFILMQQGDNALIKVARFDGLASNSFAFESDLAPGRTYYWSVRARYADGTRKCVTDWSARWEPTVAAPGAMGFVFRTPVVAK